jgi:hypothetical protein
MMAIGIDAPARVELDVHGEVPLVVRRAPGGRFRDRAVLVGASLDTGEVRARRALPDVDDRVPGASADGLYRIDVRACLGLRWRPQSVAVAMVTPDGASDVAVVRLSLSPLAYPDDAVESFLARAAHQRLPRGAWPPAEAVLPRYDRTSSSPPTPGGRGIALRLDGSALHASFRVALPDGAAVAPIGLVLLGHELLGPSVVAIGAPAQPDGTGWFALDLRYVQGMPRAGQIYSVYAMCGDALAGPLLYDARSLGGVG